ncbi:glycoside hydrolase family 65 protein [Microbacterium sp.]|uniref:glycoside hydrolase family 65 protein n=1 Tax=Microbacterium sp. TaxID=51671 RepID=UPI0039E5BAA0
MSTSLAQQFGELGAEWTIRQSGFDRDAANVYETQFTVGNGRLAARGSHEERHRGDVPGSFLAGVYDGHDAIVIDLVNAPDWLDTAVVVAGTRLSVDSCTVVSHERALDMSTGILWRSTVFEDAEGRRTRFDTARTASMRDRDLAVLRVEVTPLNHGGEVQLITGIDGDRTNMEALPVYPKGRTFTTEEKWAKWARSIHLETQGTVVTGDDVLELTTRTRGTGDVLAFAAALSVTPAASRVETVRAADDVRRLVTVPVAEGETVRLDKVVAVRTSRDVDAVPGEDLAARAIAAARAGREAGIDAIVADSTAEWAQLWAASDAEIVGDDELTTAVRFSIYHLLITANPDDPTVNIGAKSMSGEGYRGHVFWDTECVMLPFYLQTNPAMARALLGYRYHTLPGARRNAVDLYGKEGARFAWEAAATGDEECPTTTADGSERFWTREEEVHVTADVAYGIFRYVEATQDIDFLYDFGAEILFDTSRFWVSFVETDDDGSVHLRQVMGPDEFHSHVDDNAFTNFLVQWHLRYAADVHDQLAADAPDTLAALAAALGMDAGAPAQWRDVADRIVQGVANEHGVIEQFAGYFEREDVPVAEWDENDMPKYPEGYHHHNLEGTQLLKQPDVLELMLMFPEEFSHDVKLANFDYYEPRTLHKSSLSPSVHAKIGISVGDRTRALQYFTRSALVDLANNQGNTADGMHIASAAGTWTTLTGGFGGLTVDHGVLDFAPWIPPEWEAVRYTFSWRGLTLRVHADHDATTIEVSGPAGAELTATVNGRQTVLRAGESAVVPAAND